MSSSDIPPFKANSENFINESIALHRKRLGAHIDKLQAIVQIEKLANKPGNCPPWANNAVRIADQPTVKTKKTKKSVQSVASDATTWHSNDACRSSLGTSRVEALVRTTGILCSAGF